MKLESLYMNHYKKLLLIPLIIFLVCAGFLLNQYATKGYFIEKDISLSGGVSATIYTDKNVDSAQIEKDLSAENPQASVSIRTLSTLGSQKANGIILDVTNVDVNKVRDFVDKEFPNSEVSIQETGSEIGQSFYQGMIRAIIFAFILMGIVVFITFKKPIPSIAVISSALIDMLFSFAIVSAAGMKLSSGGIVAFLMVIGYSIDTDILLTTRVLRSKSGTLWERNVKAFKTGITMTMATIVALTVAYFVTNSVMLKEMFGIILLALFADIMSTWIMNSSILVWYVKKNESNI